MYAHILVTIMPLLPFVVAYMQPILFSITSLTVVQAFLDINDCLHGGRGAQQTLHALQSEFSGMIGDIREDCAKEYYATLMNALEQKGEVSIVYIGSFF